MFYKDLKRPENLKIIFGKLRDYLAGNAKGVTRDERLVEQLIIILFCKLHDEQYSSVSNKPVGFCVNSGETPKDVSERMLVIFKDVVKKNPGVFDKKTTLNLDKNDLFEIVKILQPYLISGSNRDIFGEAFESFIVPSIRGGEGQFFTPKNVIEAIIEIVGPKPGDRIIDPACGSGGFLAVALSYLFNNNKNKSYQDLASNIYGIDKDSFLARVANTYLSMVGGVSGNIFCENSLENPLKWQKGMNKVIGMGTFDYVVTNPPFGAKIPVKGDILEQYELARKWRTEDGALAPTEVMLKTQPPQILFIERCLQLLRPGGTLAIVLPDGILSNTSDEYVRRFILNRAEIYGVIDLPKECFQPSTSTKTSVIFLKKKPTKKSDQVFMSIVDICGHDKRGKETGSDELPLVPNKINNPTKKSRLGFYIESEEIYNSKNLIFSPKHYDPVVSDKLGRLDSKKYDLLTLRKLVDDGVIKISRGKEVGSSNYSSSGIPFVRTSDISNWEIRVNHETLISEDVSQKYISGQNLEVGDILIVNDGGRMVGEAAIITKYDGKLVIQSHIRRIKVLDKSMNPYLLLFCLNTPLVREQIASKVFTQATIPSLGNRLLDVVIPIPKSREVKVEISKKVEEIVNARAKTKSEVKQLYDQMLG